MNELPAEIIKFLLNEKFATISCIDDGGAPYCFNCMYSFNSKDSLFYFKSSPGSRHSLFIEKDNRIAGTILPVKPDMLALKGVQFSGRVLDKDDILCRNASRRYHLAFPLAISMAGRVYVVKIEGIKLTDNTIRFGKKLTWERESLPGSVSFA